MTTPTVGQLDFEAVRCLGLPLSEKLAAYSQRHRDHQGDIAKLYDDLVDRLTEAGAGADAPVIADRMPSFVLPDSTGRLASLDEFLQEGPLVVSLNRGSWCPFCRLELLSLAEVYDDIRGMGANVVSIIPERAFALAKLKSTYDLPFAVLSDIDNAYALSLDLMISIGEALHAAFLSRGLDTGALQGNGGMLMPITATFVVGPGGVIQDRFVDPDFRQRMSPDQVLAGLKSLL